ncbi:hypothetical protein JUM001_03040 [Clostridium perfringens]|nr:hypothetical protein JUM001_03040 [Clostridium perfringens]
MSPSIIAKIPSTIEKTPINTIIEVKLIEKLKPLPKYSVFLLNKTPIMPSKAAIYGNLINLFL